MATITVDLVVTNGVVDQVASKAACDAAIANYVAEYEVEQAVIKEAVLAVLTEANGQYIKMPSLTSIVAIRKLNGQPANSSSLEKKVKAYVQANLVGDNSLFVTRKGPGGGVALRATAPVAAPVVANDSTAAATTDNQ